MRAPVFAVLSAAALAGPADAATECFGPVGKTDTLWAIALQLRPDSSISPPRMMIALLEANPGAFGRDNVNALLAGTTLCFDSSSAIGIDDNTAAATVLRHNEEWKSGGWALPRLPDPAELPDRPATPPSATGQRRPEPAPASMIPALAAADPEIMRRITDAETSLVRLRASQQQALVDDDLAPLRARLANIEALVRDSSATQARFDDEVAALGSGLTGIEALVRDSSATQARFDDEVAALGSRLADVEAVGQASGTVQAGADDDVAALHFHVADIEALVRELDAAQAQMVVRVSQMEVSIDELTAALSDTTDMLERRLSGLPVDAVPTTTPVPTPAPRGEVAPAPPAEEAMEPMPTPAPRGEVAPVPPAEEAMEPMPTPAPRGEVAPVPPAQEAMEPMPTPAPRGEVAPVPLAQEAMEPMPTPAPRGEVAPVPLAQDAMEPMPTPAPRGEVAGVPPAQEAMEPMPTPAPREQATPMPTLPPQAGEIPDIAQTEGSESRDLVGRVSEEIMDWARQARDLALRVSAWAGRTVQRLTDDQ